jgi:orotate phosphoribosyltransferase
MKNLFIKCDVTLHSGQQSDYKINCDALTDNDIETCAFLLSKKVHKFSDVIGIPSGGSRLAKAMKQYSSVVGTLLIVDDVLTTGESMESFREKFCNKFTCQGAVMFARSKPPSWVAVLFSMESK